MQGDVALCTVLRAPRPILTTRTQVRRLGGPTPWDPADPGGVALLASGDPTLPGHATLTEPGRTPRPCWATPP